MGSEMCIRDSTKLIRIDGGLHHWFPNPDTTQESVRFALANI